MIAIYPGSFDPITYGHIDIIKRASLISHKLIVGLLVNPNKKSLFSIDERMEHLASVLKGYKNIEIKYSPRLLVEFAMENKADVIIRGIRSSVIPEYEIQVALANKKMMPDLETLFMFSSPEYLYLSSTIVKEVLFNGGDVSGMVPDEIVKSAYFKLSAEKK